jgi:hypothetical protein
MCSINFSNTSSNFREKLNTVAGDKTITQQEIQELGEKAGTTEEKEIVSNLQSKANFQDLKLSSFDPASSVMIFDLAPKSVPAPEQKAEITQTGPKTGKMEDNVSNHINLLTPLIGALGLLIGGLAGGASANDELYEAVNKSLNKAGNAITKYGVNTPIVGRVDNEDVVEKHRKMAEGKA